MWQLTVALRTYHVHLSSEWEEPLLSELEGPAFLWVLKWHNG